MENFDTFLKGFSIKEITNPKDGKTHWSAIEKESKLSLSALTDGSIMWMLRQVWASRNARMYQDDKGEWWVGEKGARNGFATSKEAQEYQAQLLAGLNKK